MAEIWTVKDVLDWTTQHFTSKNISDARLDAELLLASVLGCKRIELYIQFERILATDERAAYRALIHRRVNREPVQYILGETEFMGIPFKVAAGVLVPRQDTETLVDAVIDYCREREQEPRVLDIGTGSGCIAISLAKLIPGATVEAVEKSPDAVRIAHENCRLTEADVMIREGDFFDLAGSLNTSYDIIVSNPPYIAADEWETLEPEVRDHEPELALLAGEKGLDFYQSMIPLLENLLSESGTVFLETGHQQAAIVADMFDTKKYRVRIKKDYRNIDRVVIAQRVIEGK